MQKREGADMEYKEDLRIVRTRKLLSSTLLDMMEESSIEKISVIDLCKRAMVNRAAFYAHFEDKYHLLSFALEELKDAVYTSFTKEVPAASPKELFRKLVIMAVEFLSDKHNHLARIVEHNRNEKVVHTLTDSLAQSIRYQLGKFKNTHPSIVPPQMTAICYAGALVNLLIWLLDNPAVLEDKEVEKYLDALIEENLK